jgi:hypothetical protein
MDAAEEHEEYWRRHGEPREIGAELLDAVNETCWMEKTINRARAGLLDKCVPSTWDVSGSYVAAHLFRWSFPL